MSDEYVKSCEFRWASNSLNIYEKLLPERGHNMVSQCDNFLMNSYVMANSLKWKWDFFMILMKAIIKGNPRKETEDGGGCRMTVCSQLPVEKNGKKKSYLTIWCQLERMRGT